MNKIFLALLLYLINAVLVSADGFDSYIQSAPKLSFLRAGTNALKIGSTGVIADAISFEASIDLMVREMPDLCYVKIENVKEGNEFDFSIFSSFKKLKYIEVIGEGGVKNIGTVSGMGELKYLRLNLKQLSAGALNGIEKSPILTSLDISSSKLYSFPVQVLALQGLESLNISHNHIGILPSLKVMLHLKSLELQYNNIESLKGAIEQNVLPVSLEYLDLSFNRLTGPMLNLNDLTSLRHVRLFCNYICEFNASQFPSKLSKIEVSASVNIIVDSANLVDVKIIKYSDTDI